MFKMTTRQNGGKAGGEYVTVPTTESDSEGGGNTEVRIPPKLKKKTKVAGEGMKPKNGGLKSSGQDYMNLLYSETDSDTPDLKLPPLKGKKPRKKKSYRSIVSGDTSVCSMWTMLKIIVLVVMLATLSVLGVVSYWLMGQVNDLRVQLHQGN